MYGGGAGPTNVTKMEGGDGGARLTVAEELVLRETSVGETTCECPDDGGGRGGRVSCLLKHGRSETELDFGTSAY